MQYVFIYIRVIVLMLLIYSLLVSCDFKQSEQKPEIGTDYYALIPETITEFVFSAKDYKVYAYRWNINQPFQLTTASNNTNKTEQCVSGKNFLTLLSTVASAKIKEAVKLPVADSDPGWVYVTLRDASVLDPINVQIRIPSSNSEPVVMQIGASQFAVEMNGETLHSAKVGCKELGGLIATD